MSCSLFFHHQRTLNLLWSWTGSHFLNSNMVCVCLQQSDLPGGPCAPFCPTPDSPRSPFSPEEPEEQTDRKPPDWSRVSRFLVSLEVYMSYLMLDVTSFWFLMDFCHKFELKQEKLWWVMWLISLLFGSKNVVCWSTETNFSVRSFFSFWWRQQVLHEPVPVDLHRPRSNHCPFFLYLSLPAAQVNLEFRGNRSFQWCLALRGVLVYRAVLEVPLDQGCRGTRRWGSGSVTCWCESFVLQQSK